jgi:HlyD family secretion protein
MWKMLSNVKQTTTFQIRTSERAVESAQIAYDNAKRSFEEGQSLSSQVASQTLSGGVLTARSAVSSIDSLLEQIDLVVGITDRYESYNDPYQNLIAALNPSYKSAVERGFDDVRSDVQAISAYENDDIAYIQASKPLLDKAVTLADNMVNVLSNTVPSIDLLQETINGWQNNVISLKTNLITSRNSVESVLQQIENVATSGGIAITGLTSSLSQLENALNSAKASLDKAKTDLALARSQATATITQAESSLTLAQRELESRSAPPRQVDLQIYRSAVAGAQSRLDEAITARDNLILKAPVAGTIGKIEFDKGETVSMNQTVIKIIAGEPNEVEVNFPETDIVYIQEGKPLTFTFDGFTSDYVYEGEVFSIEPSATEIQGVIYYNSDITFNPNQYEDVEPRSGMTVNIDVIADQRDVSAAVPYSSVKEDKFGNRQVAIFPSDGSLNQPRLIEVNTGYEGDDYIEITSGLEEGDRVLVNVGQIEE